MKGNCRICGVAGCKPANHDAGKTWPKAPDAAEILASLGAVWSPDFDAYASGKLDVSRVRCALCKQSPCSCPEFGTDEYFAMLDGIHGRDGK